MKFYWAICIKSSSTKLMYNLVNIKEKVAPDFVAPTQNDEVRVLYCRVELTDFNGKSGKSKVRRMPSR